MGRVGRRDDQSVAGGQGRARLKQVIAEITSIVPGPVSAEVVSTDAEGIIREGQEYAGWAENVVIKVPMTAEGLKATRALSDKGIKTNVTLVFTPNQALLAARAGATYVTPSWAGWMTSATTACRSSATSWTFS